MVAAASSGLTPEGFFAGSPAGRRILTAVQRVVAGLGEVTVRVSKSQVAFRRRTGFAFLWRPGQYVRSEVPAVLAIALARQVDSDRIKAVAHPSPRVWMHHLELHHPGEVDDQVAAWLAEAYAGAG